MSKLLSTLIAALFAAASFTAVAADAPKKDEKAAAAPAKDAKAAKAAPAKDAKKEEAKK